MDNEMLGESIGRKIIENHVTGTGHCTDRAKEILRHGVFTSGEYIHALPRGSMGLRRRSDEERARRQKRAQKRARRRQLAGVSRRQNRRKR